MPKAPDETSFIDRDKLQFYPVDLSDKWLWSTITPFNDTVQIQDSSDTPQETKRRNYIRDHIETVQDQRTSFLQKLGFTTPVFPDKSIADAFLVAPQFAEVPII